MKIIWIGQAGLLFEGHGIQIMIDPYLSNSVVKVNPRNYRRVPVKEELFSICPDVLIFTHDHLDHYDPETAPRFLQKTEKTMTVLCAASVAPKARADGAFHNYVQMSRHTDWTEYGFRFTAVKADHSDACAIGMLIEDLEEKKTYYVTGDTLYNSEIFSDLPKKIDVLFLPINGVGNNMNMTDAARFAQRTGAKKVVPIHFGMFDELNPENFDCENRVIPSLWNEIQI